jgi:hypothetical protein
MRISHTAVIRRRPGVVFSWIADPARAARWQPDIVDYEITAETPDIVGTAFRERLADENGSIDMRGRIVAYDPGREMTFDLRGRGIRVISRYSVRPYGDASELILELDVRVLGPLTRLLEPFLRPRFERQVTADVERLRVMCESEDVPAAQDDGADAHVVTRKLAIRPV